LEGLIKKAIIAVAVSILIIIILMVLFGVKVEDILSVGILYLLFSAAFSFSSIIFRSFRFIILLKRFGENLSLLKSLKVRLASEFIALVSFSAVGDEAFRLGWLMKRGMNSGNAAWIAYFEVFCDVLIGTAISLFSAIFLLTRGVIFVGGVVAAVSVIVLSAHLLFVIYSIKSELSIPGFLSKPLIKILGSRGEKIIVKLTETLREFSETSKKILRDGSPSLLTVNLILTFIGALFSGLSLQVLLQAVGIKAGIIESLLIVYASVAIATIPITIGGSGLSELGAAFSTQAISSTIPWNAVIVWRIANYHIPLAVCGLLLIWVILELGR